MDRLIAETVLEHLARLRAETEALTEAAGDFPAIQRNALRVKASIRMMEIDLGMLTVPPRA